MVVGSNGLAGLRMDFDIRQSVAVDGNGQVTGVVNPTIYIRAVQASDSDGQVTDLMGGLVSVNAAGNSFVMQGPYGHQLTIDVNSSTQFNSGWNINDLATPAFVGVQGSFQADGSLDGQQCGSHHYVAGVSLRSRVGGESDLGAGAADHDVGG